MSLSKTSQTLWIGATGLVLMPFAMHAVGLTLDTATVVVLLTMATMGLNLLVGYTGLVSFGHSAWFGVGGYAAQERRAIEKATRQPLTQMQLPSAEDVNTTRLARFDDAITAAAAASPTRTVLSGSSARSPW